MNKVLEFFRGIGHLLGEALGVVKHYVPEDVLQKGLALVIEQEGKAISNVLKRDIVVNTLQKIPGVNENTARMVTEIAVATLKRRAAEATEKAVASAGNLG